MSEKFRSLVKQLLDEGIKPTPTEFVKRGWPYARPGYGAHSYAKNPRPAEVPGSGATWTHGRYAAIRREMLTEAGWVYIPGKGNWPDVNGRWIKPT